MNINKLFRRHSRTLLMVFMALLLVAFLIPQQIQGCSERQQLKAMKRGEVAGRAISTAELYVVRSEMVLLTTYGLRPPVSVETVDGPLDYYLLCEQARNLGLRVGRDEVRAWLQQNEYTDPVLRRMQTSSRRSYDEIYDIVGRFLAVSRLIGVESTAVYDSLPRQELAFRDTTQEAATQLAVIDSRAFVYQVPDPAPEQLQAFFDECKGRQTAHTEEQLQFGYRLPDRVQVEYLTVDPKKVEQKVKIKGKDVRQFFDDNAHRYTKPDPAATQPTQGPPPKVTMSFEEAQELVRADLREARAIEAAQSLINDIYVEAHRPWSTASRGGDGFVLKPEDEIASFEELKKQFSTNHEVEYGRTELIDQAAYAQSALGKAGLGEGQQRVLAATLAFRVQGLIEKDPNDGLPIVSLMEPAPVMLTRDRDLRTQRARPYQAYLFRVVQVAPSAPPDSIDPIREQLVKDWRLVQAHALARVEADRLAAIARGLGLIAAVEQAADLKATLTGAEHLATQPADAPLIKPEYVQKLQPYSPQKLTRGARFVELLGSAPGVPKAIFALGDTPTTDTSPAHRVAVIPAANQFKWVVGELEEIKPIYEGAFEQQLLAAAQSTQGSDMQRFFGAWRTAENVRQRSGFKSADQPGQPEAPPAP